MATPPFLQLDKSFLQMGTVVNLTVLTDESESVAQEGIERALSAFQDVEKVCSRFDEDSELRRLSQHIGEVVAISPRLFGPLRFALTLADLTDGLFDPTIGRLLQAQGFNRHYLSGGVVHDIEAAPGDTSYRDVLLDEQAHTVQLLRPLTLDLGAVAKGFAVDLAAQELRQFPGFVIDAGGDLYVSGKNSQDKPWHVGIRHPQQPNETIASIRATNVAVCTSGGYERRSPKNPDMHHLIHPETGISPTELVSSTVIAPFAMMADALSTIALLLGRSDGIDLLEAFGANGLLIDQSLLTHMTQGMKGYLE